MQLQVVHGGYHEVPQALPQVHAPAGADAHPTIPDSRPGSGESVLHQSTSGAAQSNTPNRGRTRDAHFIGMAQPVGVSSWPPGFALPGIPGEYRTTDRLGGKVYDDGARQFIIHDGNAYAVAFDTNGACRVIDPAASQRRSFYVVPTGTSDHWKFGDWANLKGGGFGDPSDRAGIQDRVHGLEDHRRSLESEIQRGAAREQELARQMLDLRSRQSEVARRMTDLQSRMSELRTQLARSDNDGRAEQQHRAEMDQGLRELPQLAEQCRSYLSELSRIEREAQSLGPELREQRRRFEEIERELSQLRQRLGS
jgi:hypothetical protein